MSSHVLYMAVCAEVFSQGHGGLQKCRYEEVKECVSKAFFKCLVPLPCGPLFIYLFAIFNICPSLRNFLGFHCPLLKAPVTMVTSPPCKIHDGSEYNLKWEQAFQ